MNKELTCQQVSALLNFYIEGKLNHRLKEYVNIHISKCPTCRKKIEDLKKILSKYQKEEQIYNKEEKIKKLSIDSIDKLSAYVDNELPPNDNIKIKKMTISNPTIRKELEMMYKFQKVLHSAYEKTKNDSHYDYSKNIIAKIQDTPDYSTNYFYKLAAIFVVLITAILGGFFYLYF